MKSLWMVASAASLIMLSGLVAGQDSGIRQLAARIELHSIPSLTLSDQEFLRGGSGGKAVTVAGLLRIAHPSGRLPTVILIHGSAGLNGNLDLWSAQFNEMGISTFVLDGFTGRGLTTVSTDQALLGRLNLIIDAYRALDVLARHTRVDPSRIAVMGFSRGGQAALYASLKRFHKAWNVSGADFASYIPFYPDCMTTYLSDTDISGGPIRIFHGGADDYSPVAPCKAYVERLRASGHDVQLNEYSNAPHSFDNPLFSSPPAVFKGGQSVRRCIIREEPIGMLINAVTKQPFTYRDSCVETDPHVGYDAAASQAARQSVKSFLKTVFKLG